MHWLWTILRRTRRVSLASSGATFTKLELASNCTDANKGVLLSAALVYDKWQNDSGLCPTRNVFSSFCVRKRMLSSTADANDDRVDQELEDGFSELGVPIVSENVHKGSSESESEDDSVFDSELGFGKDASEEALENNLALFDEKKPMSQRVGSELYEAIIASSGQSVRSVLEEWVKRGKDFRRSEISLTMHNLSKRKMHAKALQLSEWLLANKKFEFVEEDYASCLTLVCRVHGMRKAEEFMEKIPESFRGELTYRTLLASCVVKQRLGKAEEVLKKMKELKLPINAFASNQLLLLYSQRDKKKMADILSLMDEENVKPTRLTYRILINTKGMSGDVNGMDQIVKTMKEEGFEPDAELQATLARHYIAAGFKEKAIEVMKEMEGEDLKARPWVSPLLLPLYADIGEVDEVERICKLSEQNLMRDNCIAAIEAWGKLKKIEEAEALFEKLWQRYKLFPTKPFYALLKVYIENKMLTKGKNLVKRMVDAGAGMTPVPWDALVKLFVGAGEVEKAETILNKVNQESQMKPMFGSFVVILEEYAKRGDVHNAEKMFLRMKEAGYAASLRQYQAVVLAYLNAKAPAYGMRERMKADNVFLNKPLSENLARVDPFRRTRVSDLLE